ncbi:MAG: hypothetical protein HW408_839, partial [Actinobacteria bacterium]|nr:hypothetical protein [Actinomycetota bacterium]
MIGSPAPLSDIIRSLGYPVPNDLRGKTLRLRKRLRSLITLDSSRGTSPELRL